MRNKGKRAKVDQPNTQGPEFEKEADALDDEANHQWDTDIDLVREKQKLFTALSDFVPHSEIYFNHQSQSRLSLR